MAQIRYHKVFYYKNDSFLFNFRMVIPTMIMITGQNDIIFASVLVIITGAIYIILGFLVT